MIVWVTAPTGEEIPMDGSHVDDLYAEVLKLRARSVHCPFCGGYTRDKEGQDVWIGRII